MVEHVSSFEAKTHFSSLIAQAQKGKQSIITKHGHPVAILKPIKKQKRSVAKLLQS